MRSSLKIRAAAVMLACMTGNVWASAAEAASCANPIEMRAVRTAAVQQRLMVAALTCHAIPQYNRFVTTYQAELQQSDRQLQDFFRRLYGQAGTSNYHSFKTKLANTSSMDSIKDGLGYCADAQAAFDEALSDGRKSLTAFLSSQPTEAEKAFSPCDTVTASTKRAQLSR
jgi:hypothetical protein